MSRIAWNLPGQRFFEAGVDRGVLFPRNGPGVPWNGLVSINESVSGGELEPLYYDGVKYLDVISGEDFTAALEAYSAPSEFAACDGTKQLSPGLFVTQQPRKTFGLCYRTLIGNDLQGESYGYKLHIVYNITAAPSSRANRTLADNPDPQTRTWSLSTVPPPATTFRPTAHLVLDSTLISPYDLEQIEALVYGSTSRDPYLPSVAEIVSVLSTKITATIGATI